MSTNSASSSVSSTWKQPNWRWCSKCACLFFAGTAVCNAGGVHDHSASGTYTLSQTGPGQADWKSCTKCSALSFTGDGAVGSCAAAGGAPHEVSEIFGFRLQQDGEGQKDWKRCNRCQALFWAGAGRPAKADLCAAGGDHDQTGSWNYSLCLNGFPKSVADGGQDQWRYCSKCHLLCFHGNTACPAGGPHISLESGNYELTADNPPVPSAQSLRADWKWCRKCYGLVSTAGESAGICPRGGTHDHTGSSDYTLLRNVRAGDQSRWQGGWARCRWCQLLWFSGNGDGRCPRTPAPEGHSKAVSRSGDYTLSFAS